MDMNKQGKNLALEQQIISTENENVWITAVKKDDNCDAVIVRF